MYVERHFIECLLICHKSVKPNFGYHYEGSDHSKALLQAVIGDLVIFMTSHKLLCGHKFLIKYELWSSLLYIVYGIPHYLLHHTLHRTSNECVNALLSGHQQQQLQAF